MEDRNKRIILIIGAYIAILSVFIFIKKGKTDLDLSNQLSLTQNEIEVQDELFSTDESNEIYIHISGEIHYPGLIKLNKGDRLFDAIDLAGGMTELADLDQINLSIILQDEDKIYIPKKGEVSEFLITNKETLININTCSKDELMTLTGIGDKTAESIIEYRNKNKFEKIEDLMKINGIGSQKFENIKEKITI